jgi:hypothetical protein
MLRVLRRWPPLVWLFVAIGSLFTIMGGQRLALLIAGQVLVLIGLGLAIWLAIRPERGKPGAGTYLPWALGVAAWYVVVAIVGAIAYNWTYGLVALLAGAVPRPPPRSPTPARARRRAWSATSTSTPPWRT